MRHTDHWTDLFKTNANDARKVGAFLIYTYILDKNKRHVHYLLLYSSSISTTYKLIYINILCVK